MLEASNARLSHGRPSSVWSSFFVNVRSFLPQGSQLILQRRMPALLAASKQPRKVLHRHDVVSSALQPSAYGPEVPPPDELSREDAHRPASSKTVPDFMGVFKFLKEILMSCCAILPLLSLLTPQQALQRMILILAASLLMVVLLTTIDSSLLYVYVLMARRGV